MIDPVLKKFGMFEAQKSVKSLNSSGAISHRTPRKYKYSEKKQLNLTQSVAHTTHRESNRSSNRDPIIEESYSERKSKQQNPSNKIQKIKALLNGHYKKNCPIHTNSSSKIKYICLEQSCTDNLGCAQCFLYKHTSHQKAEIGACLRELQELDIMMRDSYELIISQKAVIKSQFTRQIDLEINNMCEQFSRNLQFLKNKALKQIDDNLFSKYEELEILATIRRTENQKISESELMTELLKLDIKGIERDLDLQLKELSMQKLSFQPIIKLFEQMNGALGHFMAEFKKCFPKIYRMKSDSFDSDKINDSSLIKLEAGFNTLNQFKSRPQEYVSQYKQNNGEQTL